MTYVLVFFGGAIAMLVALSFAHAAAKPAPSPFPHVTWEEWAQAVRSINRWRQLAVNQQAEIRVRDFADELYPHVADKLKRIELFGYELSSVGNTFTALFSPMAKQRMIAACDRIIPHAFQIDAEAPSVSSDGAEALQRRVN